MEWQSQPKPASWHNTEVTVHGQGPKPNLIYYLVPALVTCTVRLVVLQLILCVAAYGRVYTVNTLYSLVSANTDGITLAQHLFQTIINRNVASFKDVGKLIELSPLNSYRYCLPASCMIILELAPRSTAGAIEHHRVRLSTVS